MSDSFLQELFFPIKKPKKENIEKVSAADSFFESLNVQQKDFVLEILSICKFEEYLRSKAILIFEGKEQFYPIRFREFYCR